MGRAWEVPAVVVCGGSVDGEVTDADVDVDEQGRVRGVGALPVRSVVGC